MNDGKKIIVIKPKKQNTSLAQYLILFQIIYVLFERFFIQLGISGSIIYVLDIINVYLLMVLVKKNVENFRTLILTYLFFIVFFSMVAFANYFVYGNNVVFTILEIRNIIRFLIFFLAAVKCLNEKQINFIFKVLEAHFWVNSVFIIYQYFTFFPSNASWMRGDLLNGFFGTMRGGNTFVNVEMMVVFLYIFVEWTKRNRKVWHLIITMIMSVLVAGMIELKAFFVEIVIIYFWYLCRVKKTRKEKQLNIIIVFSFVIIASVAIQIMLKEFPWFKDSLTLKGLYENITTKNYASTDDINRFTGFTVIANKMFGKDVLNCLFGIGLGNGAVSVVGNKMTSFAQQYINSNYSWFQGTYLFVQCGILGLVIFLSTFAILLKKKKINKTYETFSNMVILLSIFLVFYGEALKTDAGYIVYLSIATGFIQMKNGNEELI